VSTIRGQPQSGSPPEKSGSPEHPNSEKSGSPEAELGSPEAESGSPDAELGSRPPTLTSGKPSGKGGYKGDHQGDHRKITTKGAPAPALPDGRAARAPQETKACSKHPDGNSTHPCRECQQAREHNQQAQQLRSWIAGIRKCGSCDDNGHLLQRSKLRQHGQPYKKVTAVITEDSGCDPTHPVIEHLDQLDGVDEAWVARCPHGTQRPGDKRDKPEQRLQELEDAGYTTYGWDAWTAALTVLAAEPADLDTITAIAFDLEWDAENAYQEAEQQYQENCRVWLIAKRGYELDVEHWLRVELSAWVRAENQWKADVKVWLDAVQAHEQARQCQLCGDDGYIYARSENTPLAVIPKLPTATAVEMGAAVRERVHALNETTYNRPFYQLVCCHDRDGNDVLLTDVRCAHYQVGDTVILSDRTNLMPTLHALVNAEQQARQNEIQACTFCDPHGIQLDSQQPRQPLMMQKYRNECSSSCADVDCEGCARIGEPFGLVCHHSMAANCAEYVATQWDDLICLTGYDNADWDNVPSLA
jgi:hypothetical protein